jgi:hypothetical protein
MVPWGLGHFLPHTPKQKDRRANRRSMGSKTIMNLKLIHQTRRCIYPIINYLRTFSESGEWHFGSRNAFITSQN